MADNQKSYFSALARGGLSAALSYQQQNYDISKGFKKGGVEEEDQYSGRGSSRKSNAKKDQGAKSQLPPQPTNTNKNKQGLPPTNKDNVLSEEQNNRINLNRDRIRLRSLMDGNDLQPLQEEVSKEEDDSTFLIKVDGCQSSKSINKKNMKASFSSIDSCNYHTKMEEGYVQYEVSNNSSLKIFDSQFQNSSQEASLQHRSNSLREAKELQNYNAKKQLAKQLLDGMKEETEVLQQQNINLPVEQRLFDYQKRKQEKLEYQRIQKDEQEASALRPTPMISQKSTEMARRRSLQHTQSFSNEEGSQHSNSTSNKFSANDYYQEQKKREEARLKVYEQQEMQGFTGKPEINKKSKTINRKVDDLMDWKQAQQLKREQELQKKLMKENIELEKLQQTKKVSKASQKILESKWGQRQEKVEDRLLREAQVRQKKSQQEVEAQGSGQRGRNRSKSTKNVKKANSGKHQKVLSFTSSLSHQNSQRNFAPVLSERYNSQERNSTQHANMLTFQNSKRSDQIELSQDQNFSNRGGYQSDYVNNLVTPQKSDFNSIEQSPINQKVTTNPSIPNIFQESGFSKCQQEFSPFSQTTSSYQSDNKLSFPFTTTNHQQFQLPQYNQNNYVKPQPQQQLHQQVSVNQIQPNQQNLFQRFNSLDGTPQSQTSDFQNQNSRNGIQNQKQKKTMQYESLFHKVSKMNSNTNTSNNYINSTPDDKSSNSCSIQFASAKGTFNFPPNMGGSVISSQSCEINPIYLSIQQEKMKMDGGVFNYQPQFYQPKFNELSSGKSQTDFSHSIDIPQQILYSDNSQVYSNAQIQGRLTYPSSGISSAMKNPMYQQEPMYQDTIIQKILENSYIPNGNVKDTRKFQYIEQEVKKYSTLQFPQFQVIDQQVQSQRNPPNQLQEQRLHHFRSNEDTLYKPEGSKETQYSQRAASETRIANKKSSPPKSGNNFYDRTNVWLQKKQNKIEIAKSIQDQKEERQCTFKPKISVNNPAPTQTIKTNKVNNKQIGIKSPRWFQQYHKETKEEGVQVDVYGKKLSMDRSDMKSPGKKISDVSGHTTRNLNQAIEMMNFDEKYIKSTRKGLNTSRSWSDQCDISCLSSVQNKKVDDDCSNFESASFMSVGREQASLFQNKHRIAEPVKSMITKKIKF